MPERLSAKQSGSFACYDRKSESEKRAREYPYLEAEDIAEALSYAAWRAEEIEVPLRQP